MRIFYENISKKKKKKKKKKKGFGSRGIGEFNSPSLG
jgi:hypothetical protein